ncbi:hypothetical protein HYU17_05695 [Candidatus Woesearchaeota archaeon]|nr:hypothetical protein [Candidatus Woesearchaeota archaeon]
MGVEEIQKINALARELMRHRIAGTSDEALLKAEEMLRGNPVNSMTAAIISNAPLRQQEQSHLPKDDFSELSMDVRSLGVRFEALAREFFGIRDEIKKLNGGLDDVNRQVMRLSLQQPSVIPRAAAAVSPQPSEIPSTFSQPTAPMAAAAPQPALREAPGPEQPRMSARMAKDEFKPEDVAIEKIFYFGKS